jgi:hypothetical protein
MRRIPAVMAMALGASLLFTAAMAATDGRPQQPKTIVFVCLHGSVKSQMAAAHFNQIARERGLPFMAVSRGITIDSSIPLRIRDGLAVDGLVPDDVPVSLTAEEAGGASKVFAFDEVPAERKGGADVTYWSDVPPATRDYSAARDAIVRHLGDLVPTLTSR